MSCTKIDTAGEFVMECDSYVLKLYRLMHEAMPPTGISPLGELVAERSV